MRRGTGIEMGTALAVPPCSVDRIWDFSTEVLFFCIFSGGAYETTSHFREQGCEG